MDLLTYYGTHKGCKTAAVQHAGTCKVPKIHQKDTKKNEKENLQDWHDPLPIQAENIRSLANHNRF